jgi:stage V sporulation protein SpoVS
MLIGGSLVLAQNAATPPADGTLTGQKIGNIISAAVSTAFPAASSIIKLIWPKPDATKPVGPAQVTAALLPVKEQANATQKSNSDALTAAAKTLSVVRGFVTECGFAGIQIAAMQRILADRASQAKLTSDETATLTALWNPTSTRLGNLTKDAVGNSIDGMTDDFLKVTLGAIRDAITNNTANITMQIKDGTAVALSASLSQLAPQVQGVTPLAGVLIGDLSTSIATAASKISSQAGQHPADDMADTDRTNNVNSLKAVFGPKIQIK